MPIKGYKSKVCGVCGISEKDFNLVNSNFNFSNMRPKTKTTQTVSIINVRKSYTSSRVTALF